MSQSTHINNGNIDNKDNNNDNNDCNDIEHEELKTDSLQNGNKNIEDNNNKYNDEEDRDRIDLNNNDNNDMDRDKIDIDELLEVGMLRHHEIENFTMDENELESTCHPVSWSNCDATTFNVRRGPNYISGQKAPSKKALYTVFAMDAYKLGNKINKIFKYINIDKYIKKYHVPYDVNKYPLPPLFILNCMVPNYPPELMGGKADGEGYQLILYAHLSIETQTLLNKYAKDPINNKLTPAVELLRQFIHSDLVNSEIRNRFKCIARIMNSNHTDFGFLANRLVKRYNGKPFLARTSSTFYHEPGKYFAADIDAHLFGYPARQGLSYVKSTIQTAIYDVGFVIEGHTNDQLPEQILACCRISKMGVDLCKPFPTKFMKIYLKEMEIKQQKEKEKLLLLQQQQQQNNQQQQPLQTEQQQQHQKKIYPKSQSNLLNGNTKDNINKNDDNNNNMNDIHRNGNVASKSAASLPSTSTDNKNEKASWGWGYFG